jgi:hypothetical protein
MSLYRYGESHGLFRYCGDVACGAPIGRNVSELRRPARTPGNSLGARRRYRFDRSGRRVFECGA